MTNYTLIVIDVRDVDNEVTYGDDNWYYVVPSQNKANIMTLLSNDNENNLVPVNLLEKLQLDGTLECYDEDSVISIESIVEYRAVD